MSKHKNKYDWWDVLSNVIALGVLSTLVAAAGNILFDLEHIKGYAAAFGGYGAIRMASWAWKKRF